MVKRCFCTVANLAGGSCQQRASTIVIARSEATKQSSFLVAAKLDCFASLAMTRRQQFSFSRHGLPEVLHLRWPSSVRGRREDRAPAAPAAPCAMGRKERTRV